VYLRIGERGIVRDEQQKSRTAEQQKSTTFGEERPL